MFNYLPIFGYLRRIFSSKVTSGTHKMATNEEGTYGTVSYIPESVVSEILTWPMLFEALEQAFLCVINSDTPNLPISDQPPRSFTSLPDKSGILLAMPGFIGNYKSFNSKASTSTLACKLVTAFRNNENLLQPLPNILGTIFLFDITTGRMKSVIEATTITERRTAAASIVATKYLYFDRQPDKSNLTLSIVGCGTQGRSHAIGMLSNFHFTQVKLWNRTTQRAIELDSLLKDSIKAYSKNLNVQISVVDTVAECVRNAQVIVTGTATSTPLVEKYMLINDCHINAVGAGQYHFNELSSELYKNSSTYIDYWAGANAELKGLETNFIGQVGEVIANILPTPSAGVTIFQSLGMAVEDATTAQFVYDEYMLRN